MKKILAYCFSITFMLSAGSIYACSTCGCQSNKVEKECSSTEKSKKSCESKCSKSKKCCSKKNSSDGFNFNKTNSYGKAKSCSKSKVKKCCSKKESVKNDNKEQESSDDVKKS